MAEEFDNKGVARLKETISLYNLARKDGQTKDGQGLSQARSLLPPLMMIAGPVLDPHPMVLPEPTRTS